MNTVPTKEDIIKAHDRIRDYIHRTPVLTSQSIDEVADTQVFFKAENFQKIGAFKARGAMNAALSDLGAIAPIVAPASTRHPRARSRAPTGSWIG